MRILILLLSILCINLYSQTPLKINKFLDGITVYDITGDGKNIWVATNGNGIFSYSPEKSKWDNYSTSNGKLQLNFFYAIDANKDFVWAGSTDGFFIFDKKRGNWTKRKFGLGGQLSNWIRSVKYDPLENVVWIGRFKYLTRYDLTQRRFTDIDLTTKNDEKTNTIKTIQIDGDSLVWFGTENGLHKYDKSRKIEDTENIKFYDNTRNYFKGDGDAVSISALLLEQGNVWIGLDEFITKSNPDYNLGGIYKYDRRYEWLRFDTKNGLSGNGVFDMALTGNFIWVSLYQFSIETKEPYGRGLALINRQTEEVIPLYDTGLPSVVYSLYYDGRYLWMGAKDGLYQLDLSNNFVTDFSKLRK